jgi:hypothetical protein
VKVQETYAVRLLFSHRSTHPPSSVAGVLKAEILHEEEKAPEFAARTPA